MKDDNNQIPAELSDIENESQTSHMDEDIAQYEQVDEILEFYKDKQIDESQVQDNENQTDDEEFHDISYGISLKNKYVITYIITAAICAVIIGGSYAIALTFPFNNSAAEEYSNKLRASADYTEVKNEFEYVKEKTETLRETVSEKKSQAENIENLDNNKAVLRAEIEQKSEELKEINNAIDTNTSKIDAVDSEILSKSGTMVSLSPGRYTVGKDIAAGKYSITGNGTFSAATSSGSSKYNTTLHSAPLEIELSSGDRLKLGCTVKFTPIS